MQTTHAIAGQEFVHFVEQVCQLALSLVTVVQTTESKWW